MNIADFLGVPDFVARQFLAKLKLRQADLKTHQQRRAALALLERQIAAGAAELVAVEAEFGGKRVFAVVVVEGVGAVLEGTASEQPLLPAAHV